MPAENQQENLKNNFEETLEETPVVGLSDEAISQILDALHDDDDTSHLQLINELSIADTAEFLNSGQGPADRGLVYAIEQA